jgi:hypothetical protein
MEEIRINYKMVWVKGSMSIGEIGINYKMVGVKVPMSIGGAQILYKLLVLVSDQALEEF